MKLTTRILTLPKLYPLAISRGTMSSSENLFIEVSDGQHFGLGEHAPATGKEWTAERAESQLNAFELAADLNPFDNWQRMKDAGIDPPAMAALDIALWDLLAKRAGFTPLSTVRTTQKRRFLLV